METENWTGQINKTTNDFKKAFESLTDEQINWKPNKNTWSIAQNIDHLIVINESYFPTLNSIRQGTYKTPFIGKFDFITNSLGKTLLKAVQPDRKKKTKTFLIWEPTQDAMLTDILKRFEKHQKGLKLQIENSQNLLKKKTVISSPANKNIVYKIVTAFDIIVAHEQRHFEQAKEVLKILPKYSKPTSV